MGYWCLGWVNMGYWCLGWVNVGYYVPQTKFRRHIVFAPFLIIIIIIIFLSSVKSLSDTFLGDALIKLYETL